MRHSHGALLIAAALLSACGPTILYDRDPVARIQPGTRWAWSAPDGDGLAFDDGAIIPTERSARLIAEAIEAELAARGFVRVATDSAEFVVHFHVGRRAVTDTVPSTRPVDAHVVRDAPGTWGGYGRPETLDDRTMTWEEGMLIVDALTPDRRTVVWRGVIVDEIPAGAEDDPAPAIRRSVRKLLRGFP
jgi:hypothetical protein